jgi:hypothetical protein
MPSLWAGVKIKTKISKTVMHLDDQDQTIYICYK